MNTKNYIAIKDNLSAMRAKVLSLREILKPVVKTALLVFLAFYIGKRLGWMIAGDKYLIPMVVFAGAIFLFISSSAQKYYLLSVSAFVPLFFPYFFIRHLKWIEMLAPIFCFLMLMELMTGRRKMFFNQARYYYIAISIIVIWSFVNFIKNPVLGAFFGQYGAGSGIRAYVVIAVGIMTFFYSFWYVREKKVNATTWMRILMVVSFVIGYLRLAGYFSGYDIPFVGSVFFMTGNPEAGYHRVGGLSEMAVLGLAVTMALYSDQKWKLKHIVILLSFFVLLFFSGARGAFMGILLMTGVYVYFVHRRHLMPVVVAMIVLAGSYVLFMQGMEMPSQIQRLTALQGGIKGQDKYRASTFDALLKHFGTNPIFGKGIGFTGAEQAGAAKVVLDEKKKEEEAEEGEEEKEKEFVRARRGGRAATTDEFAASQTYKGGHGSYVSIIGIFGIGGLVYFLIMLYGSIFDSLRSYRKGLLSENNRKLMLFAFLFLVAQALVFIPGGSGYDSMELWFLAGMVAGMKTL